MVTSTCSGMLPCCVEVTLCNSVWAAGGCATEVRELAIFLFPLERNAQDHRANCLVSAGPFSRQDR